MTLQFYFTTPVPTLFIYVQVDQWKVYWRLSVMIYIVITMGPYFYVYLWLFMFTFSLFFMTIWPEYIAPLYSKYTPIEEGPVYDAIKKLADSVEFPLTELFVVDGSQRSAYSNAYFYV